MTKQLGRVSHLIFNLRVYDGAVISARECDLLPRK